MAYLAFMSALDYVQQTLWGTQINPENEQGHLILMSLPDDILLVILLHLRSGPCSCGLGKDCRCERHRYSMEDFIHFTMSCKRLRELAGPQLFRTIRLGRSWGVRRTINSLQLLQQSKQALPRVREFVIDLWTGPDDGIPEAELEVVGFRLATCLSRMVSLEKLSLSTTEAYGCALKKAFQAFDTSFPQVQEVVLGCYVEWLASFCPNLRTVATDGWVKSHWCGSRSGQELIKVCSNIPSIKHFKLRAWWTTTLPVDIWTAMPQLTSISIEGSVPNIFELLNGLKRFDYLTSLTLPETELLVSFGGRDTDAWHLGKHTMATKQTAMTTCFKALPQLREVKFGRCTEARIVEIRPDGGTTVAYRQARYHEPDVGSTEVTGEEGELRTTTEELEADNASLLSAEDARSIFSRAETLDL